MQARDEPDFQLSQLSYSLGYEWMTTNQEIITSLYSYTSLVMVVIAILFFYKEVLHPFLISFFYNPYEPDGKDMNINFSSVINRYEVHGYIPQLTNESGFTYPLLACDISNVSESLIGWKDPFHSNNYDYHNLSTDANDIINMNGGYKQQTDSTTENENVVLPSSCCCCFSQVRHWPIDTKARSNVVVEK